MEIYEFLRQNLAWIATIAVLWPVNVPLAALTYKIRQGYEPISIEPAELWWRSAFASFVLAAITAAALGIDYWLASTADFPAGMVHAVVFIGYMGVGWWVFYIGFGLADPFQGLSAFLIYLYLPMIVLFPINWLLKVWNWPLSLALEWLVKPG